MTAKNILVAYDGNEPAEGALALALRIAAEHDAYLTGLLTQPMPICPTPDGAWVPAEVMGTVTEGMRARAADIECRFHTACAAAGAGERVSFFTMGGPADACFAEFAGTYDLAVIGQPMGDFWEPLNEPHPDEVAMMSGRPVIVAPRKLRENAMRNGAVLAWDGGRAGARALSAAMATVLAGSRLTVLHVGEDDAEIRRPGRDIMEHLSRHGLHAELVVAPRDGKPVAKIVLETVEASGAGLLIMGAYEHSRFSEAILGGVTRDVLREAKIPVLIAH